MKIRMSGLVVVLSFLPGLALAQEEAPLESESAGEDAALEEAAPEEAAVDAEAAPAVEEAAAPAATPPGKPTSAAGADGARFRFGISGGAGFLSGPVVGTGFYGGGDLRLGVQVNDLIGVYAQPQLGYYGASNSPIGGGLLGASALVEVTVFDRGFVGAGAGYGIINSPSGPEVHFRLGGYPLVTRSDEKVRRKGLSLAVDFRLFFVQGYDMFVSPTFNVGYEAF